MAGADVIEGAGVGALVWVIGAAVKETGTVVGFGEGVGAATLKGSLAQTPPSVPVKKYIPS